VTDVATKKSEKKKAVKEPPTACGKNQWGNQCGVSNGLGFKESQWGRKKILETQAKRIRKEIAAEKNEGGWGG